MKTIQSMFKHLHWANQRILETLQNSEENKQANNLFSHIYARQKQELQNFNIPICSIHANSLPIIYQCGSIFYSDNRW